MSIEGREEAARIIYQDQLKRAKMLDTQDYMADCSIKPDMNYVMSNSEIVSKSKYEKPREFDYNYRTGAPIMVGNRTYYYPSKQEYVSVNIRHRK